MPIMQGEWFNIKVLQNLQQKSQRKLEVPDDGPRVIVGEAPWGRFSALSVEGYGKGREDGRPNNQDAVVAAAFGENGLHIFSVCDGHGEMGGEVSSFVASKLPPQIAAAEAELQAAGDDEVAAGRLLQPLVEGVHEALVSSGLDASISGSTCVAVALLCDGGGGGAARRVVVANTGDCRCLLVREGWGKRLQALQLSNDQTPDRRDERQRIEGLGGVVGMVNDQFDPPQVVSIEEAATLDVDLGPARVFYQEGAWEAPYDRLFPGLAMSRSLGDALLDELGVLPTPEVSVHVLKPKDRFLIVASDGIWQVMSNEEVSGLVQTVDAARGDPAQICQAVFEAASRRWEGREDGLYRDDISVIAVNFQPR